MHCSSQVQDKWTYAVIDTVTKSNTLCTK